MLKTVEWSGKIARILLKISRTPSEKFKNRAVLSSVLVRIKNGLETFISLPVRGNLWAGIGRRDQREWIINFSFDVVEIIVMEFKKLLRRRPRERHKTIVFLRKTKALYVRYKFWYISPPCSSKQQREMTKFKVLWKTWVHDGKFVILCLNLDAVPGYHFCYWIVRPHCTSWTNWNNREVAEVTRTYIFNRRFRFVGVALISGVMTTQRRTIHLICKPD